MKTLALLTVGLIAQAKQLPKIEKNIKCNYNQTKILNTMNSVKLKSSGTLSISKGEVLTINQIKPFESKTIINSKEVKSGSEVVTKLESDKISKILVSLFNGDQKEIKKEFKVKNTKKGISLSPKNEQFLKIIKEINIDFKKQIQKVEVLEQNKNITTINLIDCKK